MWDVQYSMKKAMMRKNQANHSEKVNDEALSAAELIPSRSIKSIEQHNLQEARRFLD